MKHRECQYCGGPLGSHNREATCYCCQEKLQEALERRLELSKMALNVKQAARICRRSEGHIRRVLEHPEKYHWSDYGIIDAYRVGKEWEIIVEPLEHKEVLAKQLMDVGQGALNYMRLNSIFGLGPVLTPCDIRYLLEYQIMPLPRRKSPREREEQKERIKRDLDKYANQLFVSIASFFEEKLREIALLHSFNRSATP
jgi:hypothetical protein